MQQRIIKSLLKPTAYPDPTTKVDLIQTHVSFLFLTDSYVYKIKKPVDFGFLNFTTLDRRRFYCNEEVRLNLRLCPDMYLGVVEVKESTAGATISGDGSIIDYAVKMKRLPEERMLDHLLADNLVTKVDIQRIARTIAEFHNHAVQGDEIDSYGTIESIRRNWEESFQQVGEFINLTLTSHDLRIIRDWVETFLNENIDIFAKRVSGGHIRDCDGDIHLENICLTDQVYIFDCIEFNNRFRYSDTAADIAFFLMDLDFHQKSFFRNVFLDEYIMVSGDREATLLLDFYMVYRAVVRGKVECLKLNDQHIPDDEKQFARDKASRYFRLARGYILRNRLNSTLFVTCGLMGTGKSVLASELAFQLGLEIISSDSIRKILAGIPPPSHAYDDFNQGIYDRESTKATYRDMLIRAEKYLGAGRSVIVDATFKRKDDRNEFQKLAKRYNVPMYVIQTFCPENIIKLRLDMRLQKPGETSDGRWELFYRQKEEFEPLESDEGRFIFVDTSNPVSYTVDKILEALGIL